MKTSVLILACLVIFALCLPCRAVAGVQKNVTITAATTSGTVAAGSQKLTLIFSADFAGSVQGAAFAGAADASLTLDAPDGDYLPVITYTVTAGTLRIVRIY